MEPNKKRVLVVGDSAAGLMMLANISDIESRMIQTLRDKGVSVVGQVHDEFILEPTLASLCDPHTKRAVEAFGVEYDKVTPEQRRAGKALNFGSIYGTFADGFGTRSGRWPSKAHPRDKEMPMNRASRREAEREAVKKQQAFDAARSRAKIQKAGRSTWHVIVAGQIAGEASSLNAAIKLKKEVRTGGSK